MDKERQNKILLPLDGSNRSLNTVRYIARSRLFHGSRIVLFTVFSCVPEAYWDLETDARSLQTIRQARAWEGQQRKNIQQFLEKAKQILIRAGVQEKDVEARIQNRRKGIARDIIQEAKKDYVALITRRRGLNALRGVVLGSVATKLIERVDFMPLIIAGKNPQGRKILIGFDGSQDAMKAVDFVGSVAAGSDYEVLLLHAVRARDNIFSKGLPKTVEKDAVQEVTSLSYIAVKKLISWGVDPGLITTATIKGGTSRARMIVQEAKQNNFGTIVVGRKGRSRVRDFFIGRVANKIIYMARDRSVWIIR